MRAATMSGRYQVAAIMSPPDGKRISEHATDRAPPGEAPVTSYGFRISLASGAGIPNIERDANRVIAHRGQGNNRDTLAQHGLSRAVGTFALQHGTILAYELIDQQRRNLDDASGSRRSEHRRQPRHRRPRPCPGELSLRNR
jgi:hypothetical protein